MKRLIPDILLSELIARMATAHSRYGDFASTHEALGVALEEWTELIAAIHANDLEAIRHEALDLAAVLVRLADQLEAGGAIVRRSGK